MSLKQYSEEQLKEMSLVEIAYEVFSDQKNRLHSRNLQIKFLLCLEWEKKNWKIALPSFTRI